MKQQDNTKVILVIVVGLLALSYFFGSGDEPKEALSTGLILAATIVGLIHLIIPTVGGWIVLGWFKLGHVLGWINTRILLSIIFYLFLFPISILYRLTNKNSLQRKNVKGSIFENRDHLYKKEDLENIW